MAFKPEEVIFCPTGDCNLHCAHCAVSRTPVKLSVKYALRFLPDCKENGIDRIGFSGGEPFLAPVFLNRVCAAAVGLEMYFDRLMTNAVWFRNVSQLRSVLLALHEAGFDGTFGVSVDAFHKQDLRKVAAFIRDAVKLWQRPDCVEIVRVTGVDDEQTMDKLRTLAGFLGTKLRQDEYGRFHMERIDIRIRLVSIPCSPVEGRDFLCDPWAASEWFRDDLCQGPGQVFYVFPDGRVSVCCGYANENDALIVGSIRDDNVRGLMRKASERPFVRAVYEKGLERVRTCLTDKGVKFPGMTMDHCYFCWYILNKVPSDTLDVCLG